MQPAPIGPAELPIVEIVTAKPGQNDFRGVWRTAKVLLYSPG
jgi:hypothetical protein